MYYQQNQINMKTQTLTVRIREKALELLEEYPDGLNYSKLRDIILATDHSINPKTIHSAIWNLDAIYQDKVNKPSKGLFILLSHKE